MNLGGKFDTNDYAIDQTEILLDLYGRVIKLERGAAWEDDGAGGVIKPDNEIPIDVPAQTFFFGTYDDAERLLRTAPLGEKRENRYVLIGVPGANMQARDTFGIGLETYVIEFIRTDEDYQKLGEVIRLGNQQGNG